MNYLKFTQLMKGYWVFQHKIVTGRISGRNHHYNGPQTDLKQKDLMHIRAELANDIPQIHTLTQTAFLTAAHTSHTEHLIVDALRQAEALSVSLVVEEAGQIVGHVAVSPVHISSGAEHWYGLGPVSVLPEIQGLGIGSRLIRAALPQLQTLSAHGCVVLGEPEYYQRFGFKAESSLVLADVPAEYFMALSFNGNVPSGKVTYHVAFNASA